MEANVIQNNDNLLFRIANHLLINSRFLGNLGLFHGKMGAVIFFYHYSRYTSNSIYYEFAGELLDDIFKEIHDRLPIDFENGYLGIGWGIQYLAYKKFIDEDVDYVLDDIDNKIMERDIRRITDLSLKTGLEGLLHYILARLQNNRDVRYLFDECYSADLKEFVGRNIIKTTIAAPLLNLMNSLYQLYTMGQFSYNLSEQFSNFYGNKIPCGDKVNEWKLGLKEGCAGVGLKIMTV